MPASTRSAIHLMGAVVIALSAGFAIAAGANAQTVRGAVRSSVTGAGIPGAVVILLDDASETAARTLTDEHGDFTLRARAPGIHRLRAARIGFRPTVTDVFDLTRDTTVALEISDIPVQLPAVTATERERCQLHPDSALAIAKLWESAKTALLAAAITREQGRYRFDVVDYTRQFDIDLNELTSVQTAEAQLFGARSWATIPPETLRREGYVIEEPDSTTFAAPDIETLLSHYFIDTHCFFLAAHFRLGDSLVALDFRPAEKVNHVEIAGTLWLDRVTSRLRALDFHYVNFEVAGADALPGGTVRFARLATGAWIMTDWSIAVPVLRLATDVEFINSGRASSRMVYMHTLKRQHLVAESMRLSGGTLREARLDTDVVWSRPRRAIDIRVADDPTHNRGETMAYLVGTGRKAPVDSTGTAHFTDVVDGAYLVEVGARDLDMLGSRRARVRIDVDTGAVVVADAKLPATLEAARAVCDDGSVTDGTGVVIGSVTRGGSPVAGRDVVLAWAKSPNPARASDVVTRTVRTLAGDGRFLACGVPRNRRIDIRLGDETRTETTLAADQVVGIVSLDVKR